MPKHTISNYGYFSLDKRYFKIVQHLVQYLEYYGAYNSMITTNQETGL